MRLKGVKGSIGSFINLIMELKKCCNHAFLVRLPDASDETVDIDRFEVMSLSHRHTQIDRETNRHMSDSFSWTWDVSHSRSIYTTDAVSSVVV